MYFTLASVSASDARSPHVRVNPAWSEGAVSAFVAVFGDWWSHKWESAMLAAEDARESPERGIPYRHLYEDTRSMILALSGLTAAQLDEAATELQIDYEVFLAEYKGPYLADAYIGFTEMLRQWSPWERVDFSTLNDLTVAQAYLAWAWEQNGDANYCCSGKAADNGWSPADAIDCGIVSAVSAAKSLCHAKALMASGDRKLVAGVG